MSFRIPNGYDRFSNEVFSRFGSLLSKSVFNGITQLTLREWKSNFSTDEELYLAAHLLDALVFRTESMANSTSQHIIEMILPDVLKNKNLYTSSSLDSFIESLSDGKLDPELRFVAVDGGFEETPGKSGAQLIRLFSRATGVNKKLLLRPENISSLGKKAKALVFLDDCVGTGSQFDKFCEAYSLSKLATQYALIYIPFVAHADGVSFLKNKHPYLEISPVETLTRNDSFFKDSSKEPGIWGRDNSNTVIDVKKFYRELLKRKGVSPESQYCLNLSLGFSFSTPNNTLKAYFSNQGSWKKLITR